MKNQNIKHKTEGSHSNTEVNRSWMSRIKNILRDWRDVARQAEINRLVTRAARRCSRDFRHAIDHIPDKDPFKIEYQERVRMWQETFWDCTAYRDGLHFAIWSLEAKVEKLEKQIREMGGEPITELPF